MRALPLALIFVAVSALLPAVAAPAAEPGVPLVSTRGLEPGAIEVALPPRAGILAAREERTLAFDVVGRLTGIAEDGSHLDRGGAVAELDSALERAHLRQAELRLDDAVSQLSRTSRLERAGAASERARESAETRVALLRAERDVARETLARRSLKAPFSGSIVETLLEAGEVASPGLPVARLMNLTTLRVMVGVSSYQVARVHRGSRALIRVPSIGSGTFEGVVSRVATAPADGEHLFEVEIDVSNPAGRLRPGIVARVELVTETLDSALGVPIEAIVSRQGERVVFFVQDGAARVVRVGDARAHRGLILLPSTVPFRELVVRGQGKLSDGMRVRVDDSIRAPRAQR